MHSFERGWRGLSVYVNTLLNIHFKHLNRDTSKVLSCRAQLVRVSLGQMSHRWSSLIKKKKKKKRKATSTIKQKSPMFGPSVRLPIGHCWLHFSDRTPTENKQGIALILQISLITCKIVYPRVSRLKRYMLSLPNLVPPHSQCGDVQASKVDKKSQGQVSEAFFCHSVFITAAS